MFRSLGLTVGWLALLASTSLAATDEKLAKRLEPIIAAHQGQVAVAVKHLPSEATFEYRAADPMPTASLIKLPVMIEAYRQSAAGKLDLAQSITLTEKDKVPGSGVLTKHFSAGATLTLRDAIRLMMAFSDNTATNMVLERTGIPAVNQTMEKLDLVETKIHSQVFRPGTSVLPERSKQFGLGSTTAAETVALIEKLHQGKLATPAICAEMLQHLYATEEESCLPRLLPEGVRVAQKTGAVSAVRTAAGIIESNAGPILICVLTSENRDQRWTSDNSAELLIANIARETHEHFAAMQQSTTPPVPKTLRIGSSGDLVAALQRTLNAKNPEASRLTVDGDYGPATAAAVKKFQLEHMLNETGEMDSKTWQALGPLVDRENPTADPAVVNAAELPPKKPESLEGPPVVSCKSWGIADAKTGAIIASYEEDDKLDIASTTKLMTALVVARMAGENASLLDEVVTVSAAADATPGSSAWIREGEKLQLRELLYGLLLPSGNDASVAVAEHIGSKLMLDDRKPAPLDRFIAEMNKVAAELGMSDTSYKNPHGLTEEGHFSSVRDQLKLARTIVGTPMLAPYFEARIRGARIESEMGYQRNVAWKNSNRLLDYEGYRGLKTGTTDAAGACLVSHFQQGEVDLVCVVLGSTSSDGRYVDTRNLLRWAAKHRPAPAPVDTAPAPAP